MPLKVMTIVGTRPEIIKLSRVIGELDRCTDQVLVHTGQNFDYELNGIFFRDLEVRKPDRFLHAAGADFAETTGNVIVRTHQACIEERPDALLILGDTNSCIAAYPAKRLRIPIFHMEAGNRCFDQRVPEEVNRKIVDHLSDVNLPYTEHARRYLLAEGLPADRVIKTGSPMREVLEHHRLGIEGSDALLKLALVPGEYFLVSAHREENVDDDHNFADLLATLDALAKTHGHPVIVSTHPRTRRRLEEFGAGAMDPRVRFLEPLGFFDFVKLEMGAACVLSDSGTLTEESSILDFPAVTIRQAHERPEGMDEGTLIMCGLDPARVLEAIDVVRRHRAGVRPFAMVPDYEASNVSKKVARLIFSYTDYVNRVVWRR